MKRRNNSVGIIWSLWHYGRILCLCIVTLLMAQGGVAACPIDSRCTLTQEEHKKGKTPRKRFDPKDFRKKLQAYICGEVPLTVMQREAFFPVYFEMHEKMRSIERQKERLVRNAAKQKMNNRDCTRVLNEIDKLGQKSLNIETSYRRRLTKIVDSATLIRIMDADRRFGRRMFKMMVEKRK